MPLRKKSYNKDSGVDSLPNESVPSNMEDTSMITNEKQKSLVVDDRVLPDSGLPTEYIEGVLDIAQEGSGLLRPNFHPSDNDIYISASQIRRFSLKIGDIVGGQARHPKENERYWGLLKVEKVNADPAEELIQRPTFDDLLAVYPNEHILLSTEKEILTTRVIDLIAPIGFGQRGLIVSPPKAGKTWLIKDIIAGIAKNYIAGRRRGVKGKRKTEVHLMAVLIGERPEEVTDIVRHMKDVTEGAGEVAASNFDEAADAQTAVGELGLERAKRLVEKGYDVVIVLDSITRMARAYNLALPTSGRTLSGGFDPAALFPAKKFFGAARKIEDNGSLTIIGTCLVDTGSRMDDLIYEEFKGTGNMELHLDRRLADKRIFPAINITRSGTRQEELLYGKDALQQIYTLRRMLDMVSEDERTEMLLERLRKTETNEEFLESLKTA
ncbi:transcription termination factor Rho [Candidatus Woesebacteria bacterium RIFCSPHIGHO2_01_FULL_39_17]|uniref:Transcription termination factor Rho n=3 Tax=Candidatus Woeseibacteriota TaxID=1752722 RepID=A0A0G0QSL5_9BACT|nr:MAG: Transcription termination factor Rho [Candidatus Woesebacteria bacterium GW2011_GWB1_39_10b]KKR13370.1 MAG: Transcription termination factor Rho [Candidatus Woesebacteria bacterium GW2011_GWA1_39_21b]KKS89700.1 MAG: rho, transcription termination factor Rho, transcription termination factor Rho [Parcubacteria group bacterium GW2011_GWC1_43_11b]OGM24328.1 MAG: transcription termination factor Rho [Candidatus Woesebacteria bacterium RIFCSPHIGHO2_01_FULL_39_17]OGM63870.1 MAG: transcription